MRKLNKIYIASLLLILTMSIIGLIGVTDIGVTESKIAFATGSENLTLEEQVEQYTNSDSPNGISISAYIEDFRNACTIPYYMYNIPTSVSKRSLFSNGCSFSIANISSATVDADDNITKIIPKEYFTSVCEELYIGKEYGFYINTNYESGNHTTFLMNTVILIDVENLANGINLKDIKLSPLVQMEFVTFSSTVNIKTPRTGAFTFDNGYYCSYSTILSQSVVAPRMYYTPGVNTNDKVEFCEIERFRLHDISTVALINNQNTLNAGDTGYNVNEDKGYFFTGNNYYFSATQRLSSGNLIGSVGEVATTMLDHGMGYVLSNNQLSELGDFFGIAGMAFDIASSIVESTRVFEYSASNDRYEAVHLYNTRSTQIANYDGNLIKESHILLNTSGTDRMYFLTGDYSRAQFVISSYDNSEEYEYSQMAIMYGMRIENVKNNDTTVGILQSNITYYDINTPQTTPIQMEQSTNAYILQGGSQHFDFTPTVNGVAVGGKYVLDVGSNDVDVYINNVKQTVNSGLCEFDVTQGVASNIVLKNVSNNKYRRPINISPKAVASGDNISVAAGQKHLIKYIPSTTGLKEISSSSLKIVGAYEYTNGSFSRLKSTTAQFLESNSIDNLCFANTEYYFIIENKSSSAMSTTFMASAITDALQVGINSPISVENQQHYDFFIFTTPVGSAKDYSVVFGGATDLQFVLLDVNGNQRDIQNIGTGYFKAVLLEGNTTYYIGIRSSNAESVTPEIIAENYDPFIWKIFDGNTQMSPTSTNEYRLQRGREYRVELWIGNTRYYDIIDNDAEDADTIEFDDKTGILYLHEDRMFDSSVDISLQIYLNNIYGSSFTFHPTNLTIYTDLNDIDTSLNINLIDDITIGMQRFQNDMNNVSLRVQGVNNAGQNFSLSYTCLPTNNNISIIRTLLGRNAKGLVTVTITNINVDAPNGNNTNVVMNKSQTINCDYTTIDGETRHLTNALQMHNIRYLGSGRYYLDNDISWANMQTDWVPIPEFTGYFTGYLHTISGLCLNVNYTGTDFGFVRINRGSIVNTIFANASISCSIDITDDTWRNIGVIAGTNWGTISQCGAYGNIVSQVKLSNTGGLVGANEGSILFSAFGVSSTRSNIRGRCEVGGVAGFARGTIWTCGVANTTISFAPSVPNEVRSVGGLIGYAEGCTIKTSRTENVLVQKWDNFSVISARMGLHVGLLSNSTIEMIGDALNCTGTNVGVLLVNQCYALYDGKIGSMAGTSSVT